MELKESGLVVLGNFVGADAHLHQDIYPKQLTGVEEAIRPVQSKTLPLRMNWLEPFSRAITLESPIRVHRHTFTSHR